MDRIHVYSVCFNERSSLSRFFGHYKRVAAEITVYDGGSTDGSVEIIRSHGARCITSSEEQSSENGLYNERILMGIRNTAYHKSRGRAEWAVVCDVDEIVYHENLEKLLDSYKEKGITLPETIGYEVTSRGRFRNEFYAKRAIFDPSIDINYLPGCHENYPSGLVVRSKPEISVLHYRFFDKVEFVRKYLERQARMSEESRRSGFGCSILLPGHTWPLYPATEDSLKKCYDELVNEQLSKNVTE